MISIESVCKKVFKDRKWIPSFFIGSLLFFIPIVNLLSLGYIYRYLLKIRQKGDFDWPKWNEWEGLFIDGIYFFLVSLAYFVVPSGLGLLVGYMVRHEMLGLAVALFIASPLFASALYTFQTKKDWHSLLKIDVIAKRVLQHWKYFIFPSLSFVGFVILGAPLYGFTFFLGFMILMPYYTLHFLSREKRS